MTCFFSYLLQPDLCSSLEVDEVEIFSLIEEQIPKYKIRADHITTFAGTTNQDFEFVQFPALKIPDNINLGLTAIQIRETLNYFRKYSIHSSTFNSWMNKWVSLCNEKKIVTGHNIDSWPPPHFTYALINESQKGEKKGGTWQEEESILTHSASTEERQLVLMRLCWASRFAYTNERTTRRKKNWLKIKIEKFSPSVDTHRAKREKSVLCFSIRWTINCEQMIMARGCFISKRVWKI